MTKYCFECGEELPDERYGGRSCSECGYVPTRDRLLRAVSMTGSLALVFMAFIGVIPVDGYQTWYASSFVLASTGVLTSPPAKRLMYEKYGKEMGVWDSVATSIVGFVLGAALVP